MVCHAPGCRKQRGGFASPGQAPGQIRRTLRMPSFAADRLISDVSKRDVESLRRALEIMADLEAESRGGAGGVLGEETAAVRAVIAVTT